MGGGAMPEQGGGKKGRKKSLDATINVVPAIDLLSCCITFLLYTAVWTQISRLQVQQAGNPSAEQSADEQKSLVVTLSVEERGFTVSTDTLSYEVPSLGRNPDGSVNYDLKTLGDRLKELKASLPDVSAVTIRSEDTVPYGDLVHVIDACYAAELRSVSVVGI